jgi:hypothetical protein
LLLDAGADMHVRAKDGRDPLHYAAQDGNTEVVRTLLALGADVNTAAKYETYPLHLAASGGHAETVQVLLDAGARSDTQVRGYRAWQMAKNNGHAALARKLLQVATGVNKASAGTPVTCAEGAGPAAQGPVGKGVAGASTDLVKALGVPKEAGGESKGRKARCCEVCGAQEGLFRCNGCQKVSAPPPACARRAGCAPVLNVGTTRNFGC